MWASSSRPSTRRGPGREKYAEAFDRHDTGGVQAGQRRRMGPRPSGVPPRGASYPAGHDDHDLRLGRRRLPPRTPSADGSPARAPGRPSPPAHLDQLRGPVAGDVRPGRATRARPTRGACGACPGPTASVTLFDPRRRGAHQFGGLLAVAGGLAERAPRTANVSPSVLGSSAITRGREGQPPRDRGDLVVGGTAHTGHSALRDDQVGLQRAQRVAVEPRRSPRPARVRSRTGRVDLRGAQAARQHVARDFAAATAPRAGDRTRASRPHHIVLEGRAREEQFGPNGGRGSRFRTP